MNSVEQGARDARAKRGGRRVVSFAYQKGTFIISKEARRQGHVVELLRGGKVHILVEGVDYCVDHDWLQQIYEIDWSRERR